MFYKLTPLLLLVGLVSSGPVSSEASEAAESASEEPHLHPAAGDKEAFMESLPKHPKDISLPNQAAQVSSLVIRQFLNVVLEILSSFSLTGI